VSKSFPGTEKAASLAPYARTVCVAPLRSALWVWVSPAGLSLCRFGTKLPALEDDLAYIFAEKRVLGAASADHQIGSSNLNFAQKGELSRSTVIHPMDRDHVPLASSA